MENKSQQLDHASYQDKSMDEVVADLDQLIESLDQKHRQERKVQFLVDIRGYFIANKIEGQYVEFGLYRGEMMYCAHKVLGETNCIKSYVGLDTFKGEPKLNEKESEANKFTVEGTFSAEYTATEEFLMKYLGDKVTLIQGDFRESAILSKISTDEKIAMSVVDCNLISSIETSIDYSLAHMKMGGVLFIDDYFLNMSDGKCPMNNIIENMEKKYQCKCIEFKTYAPFARAFIVVEGS